MAYSTPIRALLLLIAAVIADWAYTKKEEQRTDPPKVNQNLIKQHLRTGSCIEQGQYFFVYE